MLFKIVAVLFPFSFAGFVLSDGVCAVDSRQRVVSSTALAIESCWFLYLSSSGGGGAIFATGAVDIIRCLFYQCSTAKSGGACYIASLGESFSIDRCDGRSCGAAEDASFLYTELHLETRHYNGTSVLNCEATGDGGFWNAGWQNQYMYSNNFTDCQAAAGSAIALGSQATTAFFATFLVVSRCTGGSSVFLVPQEPHLIQFGIFASNSHTLSLFAVSDALILASCIFSSNTGEFWVPSERGSEEVSVTDCCFDGEMPPGVLAAGTNYANMVTATWVMPYLWTADFDTVDHPLAATITESEQRATDAFTQPLHLGSPPRRFRILATVLFLFPDTLRI
jgi:hypothetical protein